MDSRKFLAAAAFSGRLLGLVALAQKIAHTMNKKLGQSHQRANEKRYKQETFI